MKNLFLLLSLSLLVSCKQSNNNKETQLEHQQEILEAPEHVEEIIMINDTSYPFPDIKIPEGFTTETLSDSDTSKNVNLSARYLAPENDSLFEAAILEKITLLFNQEKAAVDLNNPRHDLRCEPIDYFITDSISSFIFVVDTYTEGAAHHNYDWLVVNYDHKKEQLLAHSQVFDIESAHNREAFFELLQTHNPGSCGEWHSDIDEFFFAFDADSTLFMSHPQCSGGMDITSVPNNELVPFLLSY